MFKIEIDEEATQGISKESGNPYYMQKAWFYCLNIDGTPARHPERITFFIKKTPSGSPLFIPPGFYGLAPNALIVHKGRVMVDENALVPWPQSLELYKKRLIALSQPETPVAK